MKKIFKILLIFTLLLPVLFVYGQGKDVSNIAKADDHFEDYLQQAKFTEGISAESITEFKNLFEDDALIFFDIPFKDAELQNSEIKRITKDDRHQLPVINTFGKMVPVALYTEILKRELNEKAKSFSDIDYTIKRTEKKDSTNSNYDTIIYEVRKEFSDDSITIADSTNYLVSIHIVDGKARIFNIRENDEKTNVVDLLFTFNNISSSQKGKEYELPEMTASFRITYEDQINNKTVKDNSDSNDKISLPKAAGKRSKIYLDSLWSMTYLKDTIPYIRYKIEHDWKNDGKEVNEQQPVEFSIGVKPHLWNGLSYSLFVSGGAFSPEKVNTVNFEDSTNFTSNMGFKAGIGFNMTYFFNTENLMKKPNTSLFGIGTGVSVEYQSSDVTSEGFYQKQYGYTDRSGDDCLVVVTGDSFSEKIDLVTLTVPLFFEYRKRTSKKFSFSVKAGANLSIPISSNFDASGSISRIGKYPGGLVISDDVQLNYFTEEQYYWDDRIEYEPIMAEGFMKLNGYIHAFKEQPSNSLEIGLVFAMPFSASQSYNYPEGVNQTYDGYWINTENNDFHSIAYSTEKIYQYYFGISIGINLIKYRAK